MLLIAVVIMIVAGSGIYFFTRNKEPMDISMPPKSEESVQSEGNKTMQNISDRLILIQGGTFTMGSPDGL